MWPGYFHSLGYLLAKEDRRRAEQMYRRALEGKEEVLRREHTSTLDTVNNLGNLYIKLGRLKDTEEM
tara:strand:+ start:3831 stop:4031 length:201 start_codon:yes stop_codon:yes gene_type:complete